jgi:signal transduction histidine kinase
MLEKTKGVIQVDKLHAILLMEADFNFYNGLMFAKRMMDQAEAQNWIPREIYGGRKNHEAIEVALNRRFLTDIARQRRTPLAIASVDAQTCYDRMAHSIASIAAQGWQVDPAAIIAMLITIQSMKFFLRTAFGDSTTHFGGTPTSPFQGG